MAATAPASTTVVAVPKEKKTTREILEAAAKKGMGGGVAGAAAMGINVLSLMWLRTTINYQYRHGTSTMTAFRTLYGQGGVTRFYRGLLPALLQGPLSRFGDTAANTGMLALLDSYDSMRDLPVGVKTSFASLAAAGWRIFLMPIDTTKTIMQVEGKQGFSMLMSKVKNGGPTVLYHGALAAAAATYVGHFPWFMTYNYLQATIPKQTETLPKLARNAAIGFCASFVSDTCSNSIRVIKVYKQSNADASMSYGQAVKNVIKTDGLLGLFGRGLQTKILANGCQGIAFSVLWKAIEERLNK